MTQPRHPESRMGADGIRSLQKRAWTAARRHLHSLPGGPMRIFLALWVGMTLVPVLSAGGADAPKGPADWKVEVVAEQPAVNYCSVVCCAPDGRVFLAEDPMDMIGPPNRPIDRILCL